MLESNENNILSIIHDDYYQNPDSKSVTILLHAIGCGSLGSSSSDADTTGQGISYSQHQHHYQMLYMYTRK